MNPNRSRIRFFNKLYTVILENDYRYLTYPYDALNETYVVGSIALLSSVSCAMYLGQVCDHISVMEALLASFSAGGFAGLIAWYPRNLFFVSMTSGLFCLSRMIR